MTESEFLALELQERDLVVAQKLFNSPTNHGGLYFYTTDIAAAWQVVARADSFSLELNPHNPGYGKPIWCSHVTHYPTGDYIPEENRYVGEGFGEAYADTAPLAICIAALRAKGVIE